MLNLQNTETIVTIILLLIAYCIAATLTGAGQAAVAYLMGDATPREHGFLSLNPAVHIDPIGFLLLIFLGFGWSRECPINPNRIRGEWHYVRVFITFFSQVFFSLILALIALIPLTALLNAYALPLAFNLFSTDNLPLKLISSILPQASSYKIIAILLLMAIVFYTTLLATLDSIRHMVRFIVYRGRVKYGSIDNDTTIMLISLLFMLVFASSLRMILLSGISKSALLIGRFIGAL